jgi:hypothetical protein
MVSIIAMTDTYDVAVVSVATVGQAPSRNLLFQFDIRQIGWIMPISQAPSRNLMIYHDIQKNNCLFRLVRRPAEIISLHGVMSHLKVRLFRRPAEVEKGQGDAATRFFFGGGARVRAALTLLDVGKAVVPGRFLIGSGPNSANNG